MFENPRRGRQARNLTTNVPKILDLESSSEQIFSKIDVGCPRYYHLTFFEPHQLSVSMIGALFIHKSNFNNYKIVKNTSSMKQNNWTTSCTQNEAERARETLIWLESVTEKVTGNAQPGACVDVLPRCSLKVVLFHRSGHFGRLDRNVPFHLTKLLSPVLLPCMLVTRTITKCAVAWVGSVQPECTDPLGSWISEISNWNFCWMESALGFVGSIFAEESSLARAKLACSKRSDSGERCEVKIAMKSRGGLGREVRERL